MADKIFLYEAAKMSDEALARVRKRMGQSPEAALTKLESYVERAQQGRCLKKNRDLLSKILSHYKLLLASPSKIEDPDTGDETVNEARRDLRKRINDNGPHFLSGNDTRSSYKGVDLSLDNLRTDLTVENKTAQQALIDDKEPNATVAVFANGFTPGGDPFNANAQEESLCQTSDMLTFMPKSYPNDEAYARYGLPSASGLALAGHSYRLEQLSLFDLVDDELEMKKQFNAVFVAAPNFSGPGEFLAERCNGSDVDGDDYISYMAMLVRQQCEHAIAAKSDKLYAGALGCGVFQNNPYLVAAIYRMVLSERRYRRLAVCFAIKEDRPRHLYHLPKVFEQVFAASTEQVKSIIEHAQPHSRNALKTHDEYAQLNPQIAQINLALNQFKAHESNLKSRGHAFEAKLLRAAGDHIQSKFIELVETLNDPTKDMNEDAVRDTIEAFKENILDYISHKGPVSTNTNQMYPIYETLAQHRHAKQALLNVLGCILTLGVGLVIGLKNYFQKGQFDIGIGFFRVKTTSQKLLDAVYDAIDELPNGLATPEEDSDSDSDDEETLSSDEQLSSEDEASSATLS